jgi:hypothetical protein
MRFLMWVDQGKAVPVAKSRTMGVARVSEDLRHQVLPIAITSSSLLALDGTSRRRVALILLAAAATIGLLLGCGQGLRQSCQYILGSTLCSLMANTTTTVPAAHGSAASAGASDPRLFATNDRTIMAIAAAAGRMVVISSPTKRH